MLCDGDDGIALCNLVQEFSSCVTPHFLLSTAAGVSIRPLFFFPWSWISEGKVMDFLVQKEESGFEAHTIVNLEQCPRAWGFLWHDWT